MEAERKRLDEKKKAKKKRKAVDTKMEPSTKKTKTERNGIGGVVSKQHDYCDEEGIEFEQSVTAQKSPIQMQEEKGGCDNFTSNIVPQHFAPDLLSKTPGSKGGIPGMDTTYDIMLQAPYVTVEVEMPQVVL